MGIKKRVRTAIIAVSLYVLLSGLIWGLLNVYVRSYNTVNREPIKTLSLEIEDSQVCFQILHYTCRFRLEMPAQLSGAVSYLFGE
ncbi:MAG: hypothetical protein LBR54_04790 [Oscillospiraceae bacterium]|jgi:hypothetical protein|nr:hypothetical protein [Oscillospiraceae bacterium]